MEKKPKIKELHITSESDLSQYSQDELKAWLDINRPIGEVTRIAADEKRELWESVSNYWTKRETPELYKKA
jgi:hypothetical protein